MLREYRRLVRSKMCHEKRGCLPLSCVSAPIVRTLQGTLTQSVVSPAADVEMLGFRRSSPENAPVMFMSALDLLVSATGRSARQWITKTPCTFHLQLEVGQMPGFQIPGLHCAYRHLRFRGSGCPSPDALRCATGEAEYKITARRGPSICR